MYSADIKNKFIELRSQGISLDRITKQLSINKSTALDWQRRFKSQISELKAFYFEAICEKLSTQREDELKYAMNQLKRIRAELKTRHWEDEATSFLYHAEAMAYKRVQKLCALADFPDANNQPGRDATPLASAPKSDAPPATPESKLENTLGSVADSQVSNLKSEITIGENPTVSQPFPHQNQGESDLTAVAPAPSASSLEAVAPQRLCVET